MAVTVLFGVVVVWPGTTTLPFWPFTTVAPWVTVGSSVMLTVSEPNNWDDGCVDVIVLVARLRYRVMGVS